MDGICLTCKFCAGAFCLCRSCWKGNRYCSKPCARQGRLRDQRVNQKNYSKSEKGRVSHKKRQRRYRKNKNTETDQSTGIVQKKLFPNPPNNACVRCGRRIKHFHTFAGPYFSFRRRKDDARSGPPE